MSIKLSLSLGAFVINYEGSESFFLETLKPYLDKVSENGIPVAASHGGGAAAASDLGKTASPLKMTAKAIATKLGTNSGSELLYAAIAKLALVDSKDQFSRSDLNNTMKEAIGFYKTTYTSNLSNYIDTACKQGVLIETSKDIYALKDSERKAMEGKLSEH